MDCSGFWIIDTKTVLQRLKHPVSRVMCVKQSRGERRCFTSEPIRSTECFVLFGPVVKGLAGHPRSLRVVGRLGSWGGGNKVCHLPLGLKSALWQPHRVGWI